MALSNTGETPYLVPACSKQLACPVTDSDANRMATNKRFMARMVGTECHLASPKCDLYGRISKINES